MKTHDINFISLKEILLKLVNEITKLFNDLNANLSGQPLEIGSQNEFTSVLSPIWRLVIASICAEIISEFIDTEIYSAWTKKFKNKMIWGRVISSNTVALIIDSIIFCLIAFYGTMPNSILMSILISNVVIKELVTITSVPLIYLTNNISKENS